MGVRAKSKEFVFFCIDAASSFGMQGFDESVVVGRLKQRSIPPRAGFVNCSLRRKPLVPMCHLVLRKAMSMSQSSGGCSWSVCVALSHVEVTMTLAHGCG